MSDVPRRQLHDLFGPPSIPSQNPCCHHLLELQRRRFLRRGEQAARERGRMPAALHNLDDLDILGIDTRDELRAAASGSRVLLAQRFLADEEYFQPLPRPLAASGKRTIENAMSGKGPRIRFGKIYNAS